MRAVEASLWWGDERLEVASFEVAACRGDMLGFGADAHPLVELEGRDVWLTVPADASAEVRTANGWRDVGVLRILGAVRPHPDLPGAAQVHVRPIAWAGAVTLGVVLTDRVEVRLTRGALTLSLWVHGDARLPTTRPARPLWLGVALLALLTTSSAMAAVDGARGAQLSGSAPDAIAPLPAIRLEAVARWLPRVRTKHRVLPRDRGARARTRREPVIEPDRGEPSAAPSPAHDGARGPDVAGEGGGFGEPEPRLYLSIAIEPRAALACRRLWNGSCATTPDDADRRRVIRRALRGHRAALEACLPTRLRVGPGPREVHHASFTIGRTGVPSQFQLSHGFESEETARCMRSFTLRLRFGHRAGPATVSVPFHVRGTRR